MGLNTNWIQIKRSARQRIKFRKWLHYYGINYHSTIGLSTSELTLMLKSQ